MASLVKAFFGSVKSLISGHSDPPPSFPPGNNTNNNCSGFGHTQQPFLYSTQTPIETDTGTNHIPHPSTSTSINFQPSGSGVSGSGFGSYSSKLNPTLHQSTYNRGGESRLTNSRKRPFGFLSSFLGSNGGCGLDHPFGEEETSETASKKLKVLEENQPSTSYSLPNNNNSKLHNQNSYFPLPSLNTRSVISKMPFPRNQDIVDLTVERKGNGMIRKTLVKRFGNFFQSSKEPPIRRPQEKEDYKRLVEAMQHGTYGQSNGFRDPFNTTRRPHGFSTITSQGTRGATAITPSDCGGYSGSNGLCTGSRLRNSVFSSALTRSQEKKEDFQKMLQSWDKTSNETETTNTEPKLLSICRSRKSLPVSTPYRYSSKRLLRGRKSELPLEKVIPEVITLLDDELDKKECEIVSERKSVPPSTPENIVSTQLTSLPPSGKGSSSSFVSYVTVSPHTPVPSTENDKEPHLSTSKDKETSPEKEDLDIEILSESILSTKRRNSYRLNTFELETRGYYQREKEWLKNRSLLFREDQQRRHDEIKKEEKTIEILKAESDLSRDLEERIRKNLTITDIIVLEPEEAESKLPEITEDMLAIINSAMRGMGNEVLVNAFNIPLTRGDLLTLAPTKWLNDNVINTYMDMIAARSKTSKTLPKVHVFTTFFYPKFLKEGYSNILKRWTRKVDIFTFDLLIFPIHLGVHWCLAVADLRKKSLKFYDSLLGNQHMCLNALLKYLGCEMKERKQTELVPGEWSKELVKSVPTQENGSDCGVFTCKFAEFLSRDAPLTFGQENMNYYRQRMVYELVKQDLLYP